MQTGLVSVSVIAQSNISGRAEKSSDEVTVTARCKASGFRLLYLGRRNKPVTVKFAVEDLQHEEGDYFTVSATQLYKYVKDLFGADASVESFLVEGARFRFIRELCKKVPVRPVTILSFRPQYMQVSDIRLQPDSVLVYGSSDMLSGISEICTETIIKSDIRGNLHGETRLEVPGRVRLSEHVASWELEVSRFVEIPLDLPISVKGAPAGSSISVYPSHARVVFKCVFPVIADPSSTAGCFVDYADFQKSLTGRCMIQCRDLPKGVISCTVIPEVAECIEKL